MPTDLHERLANFRNPLDDAIAFDLADRPPAAHSHPRGSRWLVAAATGVVVVAGVAALAWTASDSDDVPPSPAVIDQPETTLRESTAPVAAEPATTPTTVKTVPTGAVIDRLAIGDMVMLGAAPQLTEHGFTVDALQSRAFVNGLDTITSLKSHDRLGDVVVVHLGSNGPISQSDMTDMMEALADVPQVLLLTSDIPRDYTPANNTLIYDTASSYPNVELLDWAGLADACPGAPLATIPSTSTVQTNCFYSDGIHLRPDGQRYYALLVSEALR